MMATKAAYGKSLQEKRLACREPAFSPPYDPVSREHDAAANCTKGHGAGLLCSKAPFCRSGQPTVHLFTETETFPGKLVDVPRIDLVEND